MRIADEIGWIFGRNRWLTLISNRLEVQLSTDQPNPYGREWSAIDSNTYDCSFVGGEFDEWEESGARAWGATEQEAIENLFDELEAL